MNMKSLLPKDKFDIDSVTALGGLDPNQLKPILSDLILWIQDINWPVAKEVAKVLLKCGSDIVPEIQKVLASNDTDWQFACLGWIVKQFPRSIQMELIHDLSRLAFNPTSDEQLCELDDEAKQILNALGEA
ncbi:DUF5071 domain-containing protein [Brevibacillus centrosporus]|uniref:DUF5071 domain-containing protein n=1 Tax=Brevibacillus centrosporus TaxID=54910 RepID=UPI003B01AA9A